MRKSIRGENKDGFGFFNAKAILVEEQHWYYLTQNWGRDKGVHAFLMGITQKMNITVWLKFEHTYYDAAVQHVSHYTTGTSSKTKEQRGKDRRWEVRKMKWKNKYTHSSMLPPTHTHFVSMPLVLRKVSIYQFSLQLWVHSRIDYVL